MRKIILSMQMTLDGYVAGPNDEMDWIYAGSDEWENAFDEMSTADTFLLGSKMYPGYAEYWQNALTDPKVQPQDRAYAQLAEKTKHIIFSRSMQHADWPKGASIARDVDNEVVKLKQQPGKDIIVWGGVRLAQTFITRGLVDEYRLVVVPLLLGDGKRLFEKKDDRRNLELISSRQMEGGVVILKYKAVR